MQHSDDRRGPLLGRRILVVEDRYLLADELGHMIAAAGGEVLGPAATVADAEEIVGNQQVDAALLDVDLRGEPVFAFADLLAEREVPFVFATGFERIALPQAHSGAPYLAKPLSAQRVIPALEGLFAEHRPLAGR